MESFDVGKGGGGLMSVGPHLKTVGKLLVSPLFWAHT